VWFDIFSGNSRPITINLDQSPSSLEQPAELLSRRPMNLSVSSRRRFAASDCLSVKYHALVPRTCRPARPCWDGFRVLRGTHTCHQEFSPPSIRDKHFYLKVPALCAAAVRDLVPRMCRRLIRAGTRPWGRPWHYLPLLDRYP
jgi:hypothetical protein